MTHHPAVAIRRAQGARASGGCRDHPSQREPEDLAAMREILVALPVGVAPWQMIAVRLVHVAHC
jgi:hypothetical protein